MSPLTGSSTRNPVPANPHQSTKTSYNIRVWPEKEGLSLDKQPLDSEHALTYPTVQSRTNSAFQRTPIAMLLNGAYDDATYIRSFAGYRCMIENMPLFKGTYTGLIQNGLPHGYGVYILENGDKYECEFLFGYAHGNGSIHFADGVVYKGSLKESLPHGIGEITYNPNWRYRGDWSMGKKNGNGVEEQDHAAYAVYYTHDTCIHRLPIKQQENQPTPQAALDTHLSLAQLRGPSTDLEPHTHNHRDLVAAMYRDTDPSLLAEFF